MAQGFSLKDQLFNRETVGRLGQEFEAAGVFASAPFVQDVLRDMAPLELKERINLIAQVLARYLPGRFPEAAEAIRRALPPPLDPGLSDNDFGDFIYAPLGVYVETHGLEDHYALSLDLLEALTQRFSMEFSIRAFVNRWPDATLAKMADWVRHEHYHVRRLVSEGTRPRLPWGQGIAIGYERALPLLDQLHADPTRFVTRSVANHLNDIAKRDPAAVIERLESWMGEGRQSDKELLWMRAHALRGLIKAGHAPAMAHLGYMPDAEVAVDTFSLLPQVLPRGDRANLGVSLSVRQETPLIVDYVIDFARPNGKSARKVFKLKTFSAKPGRPVIISKSHHFKDDATTFTLHPGVHRISLQINGQIKATQEFTLT
jgi:3-methyladenine DNA glycosylase AlkC